MNYPFGLCKLLSAVATLVLIPLSGIIPSTVAWENGFLENFQAVLLLVNCLANYILYYKNREYYSSKMYLWQSMFLLLLLGRELSWGRVFFCTGMTDYGPVFATWESSTMQTIHAIVGGYIFILLLTLIFWAPWGWLLRFDYDLPYEFLLSILVCTVMALVSEHCHQSLGHWYWQELEELAETVIYFNLINMSAWYHKELIDRKNIFHLSPNMR